MSDMPTTRELEFLRAKADGLTNKEVAVRFGVQKQTVKNTLYTLYNRLGCTSGTAALWICIERGLLGPGVKTGGEDGNQ